jgi:hypothetical protein
MLAGHGSSTGERETNKQKPLGGLMSRTKLAALSAVAFMLLGVVWAFASPRGSSADEDFHLVNIWCAWGDSEICQLNPEVPGVALVPESLVYSWCYSRWPAQISAGCLNNLTTEPVETSRLSTDRLSYSIAFFDTMRLMAGTNLELSVQVMRIFNVIVASLFFFWALKSANWAISRALSLTWGVAMVPLGVFFVASVNPSSWTIIGVGTYWAFLASLVSKSPKNRGRKISLAVGTAASALLALMARSDSGIYLALTTVAILLWRWKFISTHLSKTSKLSLATGVSIILLLTAWIEIRRYQVFPFSFPGANTSSDQPVPAIKTLLEVPSFIYGLFGGQSARTALRDSLGAQSLEGYRPVGFIQGLGWTDTQVPSIVSLTVGAAVLAMMLMGWRTYERTRVLAFLLLVVAFFAQILLMRAYVDFTGTVFIQPRYLFPPALVVIGVALSLRTRHRFLNKFQALGVTILLVTAGSVAWLAVSTRYAIGPEAAYTNFGQPIEWWWSVGPGRLLSFLIVVLVTSIWLIVSVYLTSINQTRCIYLKPASRGDTSLK